MQSNRRLEGKVAMVTGAGSFGGIGIGAAIGIRFAREGARVVVADRDEAAAAATIEAIRAEGGECVAALVDVGSTADCERAAREAVAAFGCIDILVNNAAISRPGSILDVTDDNWDTVMNVNLKGTMMMSRNAIPHMQRGSSIINVSSRSALRPSRSGVAYGTSKGGIITLSGIMAFQLGSLGIRVNTVIPGGPWTPMAERTFSHLSAEEIVDFRERMRLAVPLQQEGSSWDCANAAFFFASDDSSWVTGESLNVDGGSVLCRNSDAHPGDDRAHAQVSAG